MKGLEPADLEDEAILARLEACSWGPRAARLASRPCSGSEVLHAAYFLGMDNDTAPQLLWIADLARGAQLPLGWTQHEVSWPGERTTACFFYHEALNIKTWEHPAYAQLRGLFHALHVMAQQEGWAGSVAKPGVPTLVAAYRHHLQVALGPGQGGGAVGDGVFTVY